MDHPKIALAIVLLLMPFSATADENNPPMRLSDKCEVPPGFRPPRPGEYCDYVTAIIMRPNRSATIRRCEDGDTTERLFPIPRNPGYLMSDAGPEMPTRLRCHRD